jgi:DNA-binding NtrC family response regulator
MKRNNGARVNNHPAGRHNAGQDYLNGGGTMGAQTANGTRATGAQAVMGNGTQAGVLVVDDERVVRDSLARWLSDEGYSTATSASAAEALRLLQSRRWDLVLLDIKMPGMDGMELQRRLREIDPLALVIIMTGYASVETAVAAMKQGAFDYITKPFDPDELSVLVRRALEHRRLKLDNTRMHEQLEASAQPVDLIGNSPAMARVREMMATVAPTEATVLIQGESGTGKELVARAIHNLSTRRYMPMVTIHCGALTETLLESELFGHEKGAFTGAQYRKKGKFEVAEGGTVFLDEIGDISLKTQTDLLRVLQEKEITRVGGTQTIKADFRAVAATHRDLPALVKEGSFRADLFFRLNVFNIRVPPLRERREDIPLLVDHFLRKYAQSMNKQFRNVSPAAMELLMAQPWPGNVRELENAVERAMVVGQEPELLPRDFPLGGREKAEPPRSLDDVERGHIQQVLRELNWNQSRAARVLGIDRVTLYHKIKRYGLKRPDGGQAEASAQNH